MRLASYVPGAAPLPDESRFADVRWLLVAHIVGVLTFALVGAFQFSRMVRARKPEVHRILGRVAAVGGLVGGVAGTAGLFVFSPHPEGSPLLTVIRVAAGVATVLFLVLGWRSAVRRDFVVHGRWMMRAYALGAAAGTQAVFLVPITFLQGPSSAGFAVGMTLGFAVNIVVVEWRLLVEPWMPAPGAQGS
jgi:hypothetical protein